MKSIKFKTLIIHIFLYLLIFKPYSSNPLPSIKTYKTSKLSQTLLTEIKNPQLSRSLAKKHQEYVNLLLPLKKIRLEIPQNSVLVSKRKESKFSNYLNKEDSKDDAFKINQSKNLLDSKPELIVGKEPKLKRSYAQKGWSQDLELNQIIKKVNNEIRMKKILIV
ncbi:hypothetical protein DFH28DRAFT_926680 [Melampsora americana]|nr:hypothetical protein DFH28DRAFT_926680 [Melampsora americana]